MSQQIVIRVLTEKIQSLEAEIARLTQLAEDRLTLLDQKTAAHDRDYAELIEMKNRPIAEEREEGK